MFTKTNIMKYKNSIFIIIFNILFLTSCDLIRLTKASNKEKITYSDSIAKFAFFKNQILIKSNFSNKYTANLLLDLGAGISIIYLDSSHKALIVEKKRAIPAPGKMLSADGKKVRKYLYQTGDIQTNCFTIKNSLDVIKEIPEQSLCNSISGIWGTDLFAPGLTNKQKNKILQVQMSDSTIAILQKLPNLNDWIEVESDYNVASSVFYVKINIGSIPLFFLFDTGFSGSMMINKDDYSRIRNENNAYKTERKAYGLIARSLTGDIFDTIYALYNHIQLNNFKQLDSIPISSTNAINRNIIGMEFIKQFNFLVDYQNRKIYLQINKNFKPENKSFFKTKGFSPYLIDNDLRIVGLTIDFPAAKAGLQLNDVLVSINDTKVDSIDKCELESVFNAMDGDRIDNKVVIKRGENILTFNF
jgi:predicted aspartyl protease